MGRYITDFTIPGVAAPLLFIVPEKKGTVHLLCGENSVGKSYVLSKLESLYRGVKESGFEIKNVEKDDGLNGAISLYYGKIWKQKDRCASFFISRTQKGKILLLQMVLPVH